MSNQQNESMVEGLKKLSTQAASLMLIPDADVDFLTQIQLVIRNKVLAAAANAAQGQAAGAMSAATGAGGGAMGPGPVPAGPGPGAGPIGGGLGGGAAGIPTPNPDELRRVLSGGM